MGSVLGRGEGTYLPVGTGREGARALYLREQFRDDFQWGLVDGVVLQRGGQGHVHQSPDLFQDDFPAAGVTQHFLIFVNLFLVEREKETRTCY